MLFKNLRNKIISCTQCKITKSATIYIGFYLISTNFIGFIDTWAPDVRPKISLNSEIRNIPSFFGNRTDNFKILDQDDKSILIGARNHIFNLSLNGLQEISQIEWNSSDADRELCALKGKSEQDCQNYIRVYAKINANQIMICGTNSYKPRCRFYDINSNASMILNDSTETSNNTVSSSATISKLAQNRKSLIDSNSILYNEHYHLINEVEAQGRCPYNPQHNSTYIYTDGQLYSATVADFSGADPLIYREPLRTEKYDLKQLNQPAFVSALERNDYVFFFYREIAMEYMNCGKTIYSRVGRVCKNDRGGPYAFSDRWTSYLKTRLNCSVPGEYPFYFDEVQSTSQIINGIYPAISKNIGNRGLTKDSIVYAVFTTSINAIPGSAVCAYNMNDILESFEGRFKYQKDSTSNWLPLSKDDVPEPRPGKCVDDSRTLSSTSVNFVKTHTLMEQSIPPLYDKPLLTRVSLNYRLTTITVDPQIPAINNKTYDVIFVGTDNGKIIKFINIIDNANYSNLNDNEDGIGRESKAFRGNIKTIVISEMDALPKNSPIREITVSYKTQSLIVVGDGHIKSIPLHYCAHITYCLDCLNLQDPYCVWDISNFECKSIMSAKSSTHHQSHRYYHSESAMKNYIQTLDSTKNTKSLCKKYGGHTNDVQYAGNSNIANNGLNNGIRPRIVSSATRGTVTGTGNILNNIDDNEGVYGGGGKIIVNDNPDTNEHSLSSSTSSLSQSKMSLGNDLRSLLQKNHKDSSLNLQSGMDDNDNTYNKITLTSIHPDHIDKNMSPNTYLDEQNLYSNDQEKLQFASSSLSWSVVIVSVIIIVFSIGIIVGWHASRRLCKSSVFKNTEHHNQLNTNGRQITYRSSGKDINLLMNTSNSFPQQQKCNKKKDNIEHEFVSEKDRSHESKNSTENLEKEVHFSKTGTLTKVKRTYI